MYDVIGNSNSIENLNPIVFLGYNRRLKNWSNDNNVFSFAAGPFFSSTTPNDDYASSVAKLLRPGNVNLTATLYYNYFFKNSPDKANIGVYLGFGGKITDYNTLDVATEKRTLLGLSGKIGLSVDAQSWGGLSCVYKIGKDSLGDETHYSDIFGVSESVNGMIYASVFTFIPGKENYFVVEYSNIVHGQTKSNYDSWGVVSIGFRFDMGVSNSIITKR